MSPPRLLSSTREPNSHTRASLPNTSAAALRMMAACSGVRRTGQKLLNMYRPLPVNTHCMLALEFMCCSVQRAVK